MILDFTSVKSQPHWLLLIMYAVIIYSTVYTEFQFRCNDFRRERSFVVFWLER